MPVLSRVGYIPSVSNEDVTQTSMLKVVVASLLIFESDGLITGLLGIDPVLAAWAYAGLMVLSVTAAFMRVFIRNDYYQLKSFFYPLIAFFVFLFVSAISGMIIFPKSIKDWLPSMYVFTPIFIFYALYIFDVKPKEVVLGVVLVSILVSLLLLFDRFNNLSFLDSYQRRSAFFLLDVRRIVLLKNEVIFGFVAIVSMFISGSYNKSEKLCLIIIAVLIFLVQALIMESRMGFMAMGVSVITLLYLNGFNKKTLALSVIGMLAVIMLIPMIFKGHIVQIGNMSLYDSESNISIRFETVSHYYELYLKSYGLGLGQMSSNGVINNVLELDEHYNIVDTGFYSSLFQFGPLGLILFVFFTMKSLQVFRRFYDMLLRKDPYSAAGYAFLMGFTISLLPISFFTASWCISVGGVLLYLLWSYQNRILAMKGELGSRYV